MNARTLPTSIRELSGLADPAPQAITVGELLALLPESSLALVRFAGQSGEAAIPARSCVDLQGHDIGQNVVLVFEQGDVRKPIVMGVLQGKPSASGLPLSGAKMSPGQLEVDADGERLIVNAKSQLVLRCGKASITLTKAGKVLIDGSYLSSRSSGVNRIKGGSVQLN
jgi:Domain of unknown function (DUF6484)